MPLSFLLRVARCALGRMHQNIHPTMPCPSLNDTRVRERCQENLGWNRVRKCDVMKDYVNCDIMGLGLFYLVLLEFHGKSHNFTNLNFYDVITLELYYTAQ